MFNFDYDEWPTNSTNNEFIQKPYSGSIFEIRHQFDKIFPEEKYQEAAKTISAKKQQVFKIKYSLNLLSDFGLHAELDSKGNVKEYVNDINLMEFIDESNDLDLYTSYTMLNLTQYKWKNLGFNWHMINVFFNVVYIA